MVDRGRRDVDKIDVALVEHVCELAEHLAVGEVLRDDVAALAPQVTGADDLEKRGMRLEDGIVRLEHGAPEAHERHPDGGTLVFDSPHFLTTSVIAERNSATSLNWR